jgi:hypothetical protein
MDNPIQVKYKYTNNIYKAKCWLEDVPDIFGADFETASKFTAKEKEIIKFRLNNFKMSKEQRRVYEQQVMSSGLSHPSMVVITHLSIGLSENEAFVIVCDTPHIRQLVYDFLVATPSKQIWHNASFDFKHIKYHTGKIPKNFEDTMLLAKCLINDCNSFRDRVGLKELMSHKFGDWAISKDEFTLEEMYKESTIKYASIDSVSTLHLWYDINKEIKERSTNV